MNESEILRKVRSREGRALAKAAITKATQPRKLDLTTAVKARSCTTKLLKKETPSHDEIRAYDALVAKLHTSQPPRSDVELALARQFLDGSPKEQAVVKSVIKEMARLVDVEAGRAPELFKSATPRRKRLDSLFL
jgi:hypothetical protein